MNWMVIDLLMIRRRCLTDEPNEKKNLPGTSQQIMDLLEIFTFICKSINFFFIHTYLYHYSGNAVTGVIDSIHRSHTDWHADGSFLRFLAALRVLGGFSGCCRLQGIFGLFFRFQLSLVGNATVHNPKHCLKFPDNLAVHSAVWSWSTRCSFSSVISIFQLNLSIIEHNLLCWNWKCFLLKFVKIWANYTIETDRTRS